MLKDKPYIPHTKLFFKFLLNSLSKREKSKKWSGYRPKRKYGRKRSLEPYLNHFFTTSLPNNHQIFQKFSKSLAKKVVKSGSSMVQVWFK